MEEKEGGTIPLQCYIMLKFYYKEDERMGNGFSKDGKNDLLGLEIQWKRPKSNTIK